MRINVFEIDIFASVDAPLDVIDDILIARSPEQAFCVNYTGYGQTVHTFSHNGRNVIQTWAIFIDKF